MDKLIRLLKIGSTQTLIQMAGTIYFCNTVSDMDWWLIDSGATFHFTNNAEMLTNVYEIGGMCIVKLRNGKNIVVHRAGTCHLNKHLVLQDVLLIPEFKVNLISVGKLVKDNNCTI